MNNSAVRLPKGVDLTAYVGLWVALVRGQITGTGTSAAGARLASKHQRPKDEPLIVFVPEDNIREFHENSRKLKP